MEWTDVGHVRNRWQVRVNLYWNSGSIKGRQRLGWSRDSVLAFGTQVHGFKPGRSRRIFRAKKSSARLPSKGK